MNEEPTIVTTRQINENAEFVRFDDESVEIRNDDTSFIFTNDEAYALFLSLQSMFCNTPIVEHSGNSY